MSIRYQIDIAINFFQCFVVVVVVVMNPSWNGNKVLWLHNAIAAYASMLAVICFVICIDRETYTQLQLNDKTSVYVCE